MENQIYDRTYTNSVMILLALIILVVMYVEGMLTPSLPTIAKGFGVSIGQVSLILSVYMITGVALSPIVGKMGDIYGKKKMMVIMIFIYAGAVSITGFSPNFEFMIGARALQGVGLTIMPLGMSLIREEFPRELVPKAQALISGMFGAGFAISLPLGSFISNDYGWRMTYHSAIPFVLILAFATLFFVRESKFRTPDVKIDILGAILLGAPLSMIVLALSEGSTWGWESLPVVSLLFAGLTLFIPMFLYERRYHASGGEAIFDMDLLKERNVLMANLTLTVTGIGMYLSMQTLSYRFDTPKPYGFGFDILGTGLSMVAFAVGMIVFAIITGKIITRIGIKPLAVTGIIVAGLGFLELTTNPGYYITLLTEVVIGSGISIMNASIINLLVLSVEPRKMGLATSMNSTFRFLGSSIGAPMAAAIMSAYQVTVITPTTNGLETVYYPTGNSFSMAFMAGAITFIASILFVILSREMLGKRKDSRSELGMDLDSPVFLRLKWHM